jgi:hypothetical protein
MIPRLAPNCCAPGAERVTEECPCGGSQVEAPPSTPKVPALGVHANFTDDRVPTNFREGV